MYKDKDKLSDSMEYWVKQWYELHPSYYPVVINYIRDNTDYKRQSIYNWIKSNKIPHELMNFHHIRVELDKIFNEINSHTYIHKKNCAGNCKTKNVNNNTTKVNTFLRDNPIYEQKMIKHNEMVTINRKLTQKEYYKNYYQNHLDERKEYNDKRREHTNNYYREYYQDETTGYKEKHLDRTKEQKRKRKDYYQKLYWNNPEHYRKLSRDWYYQNKEKQNENKKTNL